MRIVLGSLNPVKLAAARQIFPAEQGYQVLGLEVASGVRPQPLSELETLHGAQNRAQQARAQTGADLGIGLEAGADLELGFLTMYGAITDGAGWGLGRGPGIALPPAALLVLRQGQELNQWLISAYGSQALEAGAIGALSGGKWQRQQALAAALELAWADFNRPR